MRGYLARYCVAGLTSLGLAIVYGLKVNFHVGMVAMINHTHFRQEGDRNETINEEEDGPFTWSTSLRGWMFSAYFWGYLLSEIPGGRLAEKWSAKWVLFISVIANIVLTMFMPLFSTVHPGLVIASRFGMGLFGGLSFPATHALLAMWSVPTERSVMSTISYCGTALGTVIFTLCCGFITSALSWEWIFYIEGGASCIWLILWIFLVSDDPTTHKLITEKEREFILENLDESHHDAKMPWKAAFTSSAFYAILIAHTCSNWGWYMFLIELPSYLKEVLNFEIKNNALFSSLPYLCMLIFSLILSNTLDLLIRKKFLSATIARKIATGFASVVPAICVLVLCWITEPTAAVALMVVAIMCVGGMYCGFLSNHIDIAPRFAGTLMAITNSVATIPGILVPIFIGELTKNDASIKSWRIAFFVTIGLYIIEVIVYVILGSGEEQSWNQVPE